LTARLQDLTASDYLNTSVSFDEFTRLAAKIAYIAKQSRDGREKEPGNRKKSNRGSGGNKGANPPARTPSDQNKGKPSREEIAAMIKDGRCFNCRKQGHRSNECPEKDQAARIRRIADKYAADGTDTPSPSGLPMGNQQTVTSNKDRVEELSDSGTEN
jgi:hypothetical protein